MKKLLLVLFISILSVNAFAKFSVEEAEENMEKVMDFNGRIKIIHPNKEKIYLSAGDIISYQASIDKTLGWVKLEIKTKGGEVIKLFGKEGLYSMKYNSESNLLTISPEEK